jgi:hypothetical protein
LPDVEDVEVDAVLAGVDDDDFSPPLELELELDSDEELDEASDFLPSPARESVR